MSMSPGRCRPTGRRCGRRPRRPCSAPRPAPARRDAGGGRARGEVRDAAGRCLAVGTTWARFVAGVPAEVLNPPDLPADIARGACLSDLLGVRVLDDGLLSLPPRA